MSRFSRPTFDDLNHDSLKFNTIADQDTCPFANNIIFKNDSAQTPWFYSRDRYYQKAQTEIQVEAQDERRDVSNERKAYVSSRRGGNCLKYAHCPRLSNFGHILVVSSKFDQPVAEIHVTNYEFISTDENPDGGWDMTFSKHHRYFNVQFPRGSRADPGRIEIIPRPIEEGRNYSGGASADLYAERILDLFVAYLNDIGAVEVEDGELLQGGNSLSRPEPDPMESRYDTAKLKMKSSPSYQGSEAISSPYWTMTPKSDLIEAEYNPAKLKNIYSSASYKGSEAVSSLSLTSMPSHMDFITLKKAVLREFIYPVSGDFLSDYKQLCESASGDFDLIDLKQSDYLRSRHSQLDLALNTKSYRNQYERELNITLPRFKLGDNRYICAFIHLRQESWDSKSHFQIVLSLPDDVPSTSPPAHCESNEQNYRVIWQPSLKTSDKKTFGYQHLVYRSPELPKGTEDYLTSAASDFLRYLSLKFSQKLQQNPDDATMGISQKVISASIDEQIPKKMRVTF